MNYKLISFAPSPFELQTQVEIKGNELFLCYQIKGPLNQLLLPKLNSSSNFKDELWKHTCLEFFVKNPKSSEYTEFNFSPSGDYAVYHFKNYRERDFDFIDFKQPNIKAYLSESLFELNIKMPLIKGEIGITAVIEDQHQSISYFALAHKKERPDFHDPASFIVNLN